MTSKLENLSRFSAVSWVLPLAFAAVYGGCAGAGVNGGGAGGADVPGTGGAAAQTGGAGTTASGGRTSSGGAGTGGAGTTSTGGAGTTASGGTSGGTGDPPILGTFTEDFEDGDLLLPNRWLSTVYDTGGDTSMWSTATDGTKVAKQGVAAKETELVSGDYRWRDAFIEAKVKLLTPDPRAGVCVRYKSVRDKYCLYIENLAEDTGVVSGQIELRMRSMLGSPGSLPKVKTRDVGVVASLAGWNTVRLEVRGNVYTAIWNGVTVFTFTDTGNLVDAGGIAIATMDEAMAEFDDVTAGPL